MIGGDAPASIDPPSAEPRLTLDGKVAIVTGAARGLGRAEALELARRGARVVVNDLGTRGDGSARDEEAARAVVEEIRGFGGEAIAHFGDVADWASAEALVKLAVERFGDLHVLVLNAGFLRDQMLFNMSEENFDAVVRPLERRGPAGAARPELREARTGEGRLRGAGSLILPATARPP